MSLPDCGTAFERVRQGAGDVDLAGQNGAVASAPLGEAGRTSTTGSALHGAGGIGGLLAVCDLNDTPGAEQTGDDLQYIYAYDGNGNVVQVLHWSASSATAAIVAKYVYDPYGFGSSGSNLVWVRPTHRLHNHGAQVRRLRDGRTERHQSEGQEVHQLHGLQARVAHCPQITGHMAQVQRSGVLRHRS